MTVNVNYSCSGCGKNMEIVEAQQAAQFLMENQRPADYHDNLFCSRCQEFAADYWAELIPVWKEAQERFAATIINFRKKYFRRQIHELKVAQ